MGLTSEIAEKVGIIVLMRHGMELISSKDIDVFVGTVCLHGYRIIGVEGFFVRGDDLIPDMDAIADYSLLEHSRPEETISETKKFLAKLDKRLRYFDCTLT